MSGDQGLVAVTDIAWTDLSIEAEVLAVRGYRPVPVDEIDEPERVRAILTCWAQVDGALLDRFPQVRAVSRYGVGLDNIDQNAAAQRSVRVSRVADYCVDEVATHAVALVLALWRRLPEYRDRARSGEWGTDGELPLRRLQGARAAVLGRGAIGRRTAELLGALGMVVGDDPTGADVLSLHLPLTDQTAGLVDAAYLDRLAPGAVVVNTSRGGVLDQASLYAAVRSGRICGAGLDVLADEPPDPHDPLLSHPRVLVTPHVAFYSQESLADLRRRAAQNVVAALDQGGAE